jgi:hypothetical protein
MYLIIIRRTPINFRAATDNQLDPSRSPSLLSMILTINGAERWNRRQNTYIHLVDPIPLSQWHLAQNRTRLKNVGWTFAILLCKANNQWMIEAHRPRKRSPRLRVCVCHGRNRRVIMARNVLLEQFHDPCRILRFRFGS